MNEEKILPLQLMITPFQSGSCKCMIDTIQNKDLKNLLLAEYYYFKAEPIKATSYAKPYLSSPDEMIRMYAWILYTFGNVSLGKSRLSAVGVEEIQKTILNGDTYSTKEKNLTLILIVEAARILFDLPVKQVQIEPEVFNEFPEQMKIFASYLKAHEAYNEGKYQKSLGMIETTLLFASNTYPILFIYLYIVAAVDAISLKQIEQGQDYFMKAWILAQADGFLEPIGEYHGLLKGLVETCIRQDYPKLYKKIVQITNDFGHGWMKVRDLSEKSEAADLLTSIEFTIASLADRDWTNQEIADYLGISIRTVKYHMTSIFNKFNINSRKEIREHLPS